MLLLRMIQCYSLSINILSKHVLNFNQFHPKCVYQGFQSFLKGFAYGKLTLFLIVFVLRLSYGETRPMINPYT